MRRARHAIRFMIVLLAALLAPGQVHISDANETWPRDNLPGKTLALFCVSKEATDSGLCTGYILGIAEAMNTGQPVYQQRTCNNDGIKAQQLADLVRMELVEHPEWQTQKAGPMVAAILARAFPCEPNPNPAPAEKVTTETLRP